MKNTSSGPVMSVNGAPTAPALFQVGFFGELTKGQSQIGWAGKYGVNIISPTIWGMPWFKDGEEPTLVGTDIAYWLDGVLAANPKALLIPRFPVDQPPTWWIESHPDEMMLNHDGSRGIASIHSQIWRRDAAKQIGNMVRLLEQKYGDHMIGYHPCGQSTAEWFYNDFWEKKHTGFEKPAIDGFRQFLKKRYGTDAALRTAWKEPSVTLRSAQVPSVEERMAASAGSFRDPMIERKAIDFDEYQNIDMADAVAAMCKAVKDAAPNRLAIAFYGYTFELSGAPRSGHLGLSRLLKSPYVDGICAPYSYGDREPGGAGRFMAPVDSVLAAGKMWFTEDDTRTHLTAPDAGPGRCKDSRESKDVMTRNFAHVLTRGAGLWWMEPIGAGAYAEEDLCRHMGALAQTYQSNMPSFSKYKPEIAVIVDEPSCYYVKPFVEGQGEQSFAVTLMTIFRQQYYRIGAPIGLYLLDDLIAGKVPPAKMYIFVNSFKLDNSQLSAIRKQICNRGRLIVWMYAPGIVSEGKTSPNNVSKIVGIGLKQIPATDGAIIEGSGEKFQAQNMHLSPTFAVDDTKATSIARYLSGDTPGEVAVASKKLKDYTSVYCGALQLPAKALKQLAASAGVHIYNDQDQIVTAGNGFVSLHATTDGKKTLRLPREYAAVDAITNENLGKNSVFTFDMRVGETRLIRVEKTH